MLCKERQIQYVWKDFVLQITNMYIAHGYLFDRIKKTYHLMVALGGCCMLREGEGECHPIKWYMGLHLWWFDKIVYAVVCYLAKNSKWLESLILTT